MGIQQFSDKKIRKINNAWGWNLDMIWNTSDRDGAWYPARTKGDHHIAVNIKTGEVQMGGDWHATSCPNRGNPRA